ncbi:MAG: hypothetical protein CM15mP71_6920 [Candidatus Poseidoniales archaeon]|nr:MAG: hypothetical protein CM15mP71_6920 [Candidatus Poseidoniales archaeon]
MKITARKIVWLVTDHLDTKKFARPLSQLKGKKVKIWAIIGPGTLPVAPAAFHGRGTESDIDGRVLMENGEAMPGLRLGEVARTGKRAKG